MSFLKKDISDPALVVPLNSMGVNDSPSYKVALVEILAHQVCTLRNKKVTLAKVL